MQRKSTRQSPAASQAERKFIAEVKGLPCAGCGSEGPSIADHIWGSSKKLYDGLLRVHVGHWAVIPLCWACDSIKTNGSRKAFEGQIGSPIELWFKMLADHELIERVPLEVRSAMAKEALPW